MITATTGAQALALCEQKEPEYISLDLKLAEETGMHLIPKLKAINPKLQHCDVNGLRKHCHSC